MIGGCQTNPVLGPRKRTHPLLHPHLCQRSAWPPTIAFLRSIRTRSSPAMSGMGESSWPAGATTDRGIGERHVERSAGPATAPIAGEAWAARLRGRMEARPLRPLRARRTGQRPRPCRCRCPLRCDYAGDRRLCTWRRHVATAADCAGRCRRVRAFVDCRTHEVGNGAREGERSALRAQTIRASYRRRGGRTAGEGQELGRHCGRATVHHRNRPPPMGRARERRSAMRQVDLSSPAASHAHPLSAVLHSKPWSASFYPRALSEGIGVTPIYKGRERAYTRGEGESCLDHGHRRRVDLGRSSLVAFRRATDRDRGESIAIIFNEIAKGFCASRARTVAAPLHIASASILLPLLAYGNPSSARQHAATESPEWRAPSSARAFAPYVGIPGTAGTVRRCITTETRRRSTAIGEMAHDGAGRTASRRLHQDGGAQQGRG